MKALIFILPAIAIGIGGAAMTGMINVPGLSPQKAKPKVAAKIEPPAAKPEPAPPLEKSEPPPKVVAKEEIAIDPDLGQRQLAKLWREIETPKLLVITAKWKDAELAGVMTKMPAAKNAEILSAMPPARASRLSREIQSLASIAPTP